MGMPRTSGFSALGELPDLNLQMFPLAREVSPIGDHELFARGAIPLERLFIGVDRSEKRSDQPAQKDTRQVQRSRGYIHYDRTVRQHLRRIHLPPLPLRCRLQLVYP